MRDTYHFFTFRRNGRDQAVNLLETVSDETDTPLAAINLEFDGNCAVRDFVAAAQALRPHWPVLSVTP